MNATILRKPSSIATSIQMKRDQDKRAILLLEGTTDERVFDEFIDSTKTKIVITYGKNNLIDVARLLIDYSFKGFLGIIDADYYYLDGEEPGIENLFLTDHHDLENLILSSSSFMKIVNEFGITSKVSKFSSDLRKDLFIRARPLGYLRWISVKDNFEINFNKCDIEIEFEKLVDKETLDMDLDNLIAQLIEWSGDSLHVDKEAIKSRIVPLIEENSIDPLLLCQGSDIIKILTIGLIYVFGNKRGKTLNANVLDGMFRVSYKFKDFKKTKLFEQILSWEKTNSPYVIFQN